MARSLLISIVNIAGLISIHLLDLWRLEVPAALRNSMLFFVALAIVFPAVATFMPIFEAIAELRRQQSKSQAMLAIALSLIGLIGWVLTFAIRG